MSKNMKVMENAEKDEYRFYAFISYSRNNEDIAVWLQKKLEAYRLPAVLQKQHSELPKKLKIFRDRTDIGVGGTVKDALSRELADSKKLIVICSPDSAKSKYVEYEIESFLKLGRSTDNILPFVVEGIIDSSSPADCYTPKLHELNLNAADMTQDGKTDAFIRLLASLMDLKYDDLKRREHIRAVRRNTLIGSAAAILFATIFAVFWYIWPHTQYYDDYITRWGIPEGIYKLSKKQAKLQPFHYEITTKCWRPVKVVHANAKGTAVTESFWAENQNRPSVAEYKYANSFFPTYNKKSWQLKEAMYHFEQQKDIMQSIVSFDEKEVLQPLIPLDVKLEYTFLEEENSCYLDFYCNSKDNMRTVLYPDVLSDSCIFYSDVSDLSNAEQFFFENDSAIYRLCIEYDDSGYSKSVAFLNKNNLSVSDKNGILSWNNEFDDRGRLIKQSYIGDGKSRLQVAHKKVEYDDSAIKAIRFLSPKEKLALNNVRNYAEANFIRKKKDSKTYLTATFLNERNAPSNATVINGMSSEDIYDENCFLINRTVGCKSANEEKRVFAYKKDNKGMNKELTVTSYKGDVLESIKNAFYDQNGQIDTIKIFNSQNELLEEVTFKRIMQDDGLYIDVKSEQNSISYSYDKNNRLIQQKIKEEKFEKSINVLYYGDNKSICYFKGGSYYQDDKRGFARANFSYSNGGKLNYIQFRSVDGSLAWSNHLGFSEYKAIYSPNGILLQESFYNQNGELINPMLKDYAVYSARQSLDESFIEHGEYRLSDGKFHPKKAVVQFDSEINSEGNVITVYRNAKGMSVSFEE